ncbi:MAG: SGNH/GDSL hydrolase family protein [Hominenteromicrobium sp.]
MKRYTLSEIPHLVHGRTNGETEPLTLFWTASGLEVNVRAAELWVELQAGWSLHEPWYSFEVNGVFFSRRMAKQGTERVCIFRGMNPDTVKNVRIIKDTQAMNADPESVLQICALETDGAFEPVEPRALKLEFIGDSITSGEGDIGAKAEEDWISMFFSAQNNYAVMTGRALNADIRVISQSGWGIGCAWDNNPHGALPPVYEEVCGLLSGAKNEALGAHRANDFAAWQPDYVFINLGTNDCGSFNQPAWRDEKTGETFQNRREPDGSFCAADLERLQGKATAFLRTLRRCNPKAELVWIYGMLGLELAPALEAAVARYKAETGDAHAAFLALTDDLPNRGCRNHPGVGAHRTASEELTAYIRTRA